MGDGKWRNLGRIEGFSGLPKARLIFELLEVERIDGGSKMVAHGEELHSFGPTYGARQIVSG